jgi:hypothetical protein
VRSLFCAPPAPPSRGPRASKSPVTHTKKKFYNANSTGATSQQRAKIIPYLHLLLFIFKWILLWELVRFFFFHDPHCHGQFVQAHCVLRQLLGGGVRDDPRGLEATTRTMTHMTWHINNQLSKLIVIANSAAGRNYLFTKKSKKK